MAAKNHDIVVDVLDHAIDRVHEITAQTHSLLLTVAPDEIGTLALGMMTWAMSWAAPTWLPEIRTVHGALDDLSTADRLSLALLSVRAAESSDPVKAVRADMAALRRMGRV